MGSGRVLTHPMRARQRFTELSRLADEAVDLTEASLVIAQEHYPSLSIETYLGQIEAWSDAVRGRLLGSHDLERIIEEINRLLFEQEGFHGEAGDYYDPRNAYLNEVLDRHAGLPLALSIVYLELSRRVGLSMSGVALPGRFLVRARGEATEILIDPFDGGRMLTAAECQVLIDLVYGGGVQLGDHHLRSVANREIIVRLLFHLKSLYLAHHDLASAIAAIDRLLLLDERDAAELRDRGLLALQMHRYQDALEDLERYLELAPQAEDVSRIREQIAYLRAWLHQN